MDRPGFLLLLNMHFSLLYDNVMTFYNSLWYIGISSHILPFLHWSEVNAKPKLSHVGSEIQLVS